MRGKDYSKYEFFSPKWEDGSQEKHIFSSISLTIMPDNDMLDGEMEDYIPVKGGKMPEGGIYQQYSEGNQLYQELKPWRSRLHTCKLSAAAPMQTLQAQGEWDSQQLIR